jgi:hypothetical protein
MEWQRRETLRLRWALGKMKKSYPEQEQERRRNQMVGSTRVMGRFEYA